MTAGAITDIEWSRLEEELMPSEPWSAAIDRLVPGWETRHRAYKKQIDEAMKKIAPTATRSLECREAVTRGLIHIELISYIHRSRVSKQTKAGKSALLKLAGGLDDIRLALGDENLDPQIRSDIGALFSKKQIPVGLRRLAGYLREEAGQTTGRGTLTGTITERKKFAVSEAHALLFEFSTPSVANDTREDSRFCQLAAILFGDKTKNLRRQCRQFIQDRPDR